MNDLFTQIFSALFFVIVLIFGLSLIYKKRQKSPGFMDIIQYRPFGQKIGIAAMKIKEEVFILGITPTDIKVIERFRLEKHTIDTEVKLNDNISEKIQRLKKIKESL